VRKEIMAMPVEMIDASGKLLEIRIRGMLKKADYDRIVEIAKEAISREGKVRALTTEGSSSCAMAKMEFGLKTAK